MKAFFRYLFCLATCCGVTALCWMFLGVPLILAAILAVAAGIASNLVFDTIFS